MSLQKFKKKYSNIENAIVMGNGPSLNQYDFDKISERKKDDTVFLACNRISNLFLEKSLKWRPDIFTCFTSVSLQSNEWRESIDRCLSDEKITSFVFEKYKNFSNISEFHDKVFFCSNVFEHNRHEKIKKNFIDISVNDGLVKSYSATVTLFQICSWLKVKNIYIVGQDGYTKEYGDNHFSKTYKFEPGNFVKSNNRIISVHRELKRYFIEKRINIFNSSKTSILKEIYDYKDLDLL